MTDHELNEAICEIMPVNVACRNDEGDWVWNQPGPRLFFSPKFDLNAMARAEETLSPEERGQYRIELERTHGHLHHGPCGLLYWYEQMHSSSRQRAEAFLRVKRKSKP
jgi:hypothetical protein